jgi:putative cell wall-binding protein
MVGGVIGVTAGTAGAAAVTVGSFHVPSPTTITAGTTTNQPVGTLILTVTHTVSKTFFKTQVVTLTIKDTTTPSAGHTTTYDVATTTGTPTITGPGSAVCGAVTTTTITCTLSKTATTAANAVFTWKHVRVNSVTGRGKVLVTAADTTNATIKFVPTTAVAANFTAAAPTSPTHAYLANLTTRPVPPIGESATGRSVGSWAFTLTAGSGTTAANRGVGAGEHLKIRIAPHSGTVTCPGTKAVAFAAKPKVTVTATTTRHTTLAATKIKVSVGALTSTGAGGCTAFFAPNEVTISFTSSVKFTAKHGQIVLIISTVKYGVAPNTTEGTVTVSARFLSKTTSLIHTTTATDATTFHATTFSTAKITSTNAVVSHSYVTVKTPKTIAPLSFDSTIGTISVVESVAGAVPKGFVCLSLHNSTRPRAPGWKNTTTYHTTFTSTFTSTFTWNAASKPVVKVSGGNATASTAALTTATSRYVLSFKVTAASHTKSPSTFTVSGLAVNDNTTTSTAKPLVTGWFSTAATCTNTPLNTRDLTDNVAVAFTTGKKHVQQVYGETAAATAVAEMEHVFTTRGGNCPKAPTSTFTTAFLGRTERPVVLATSKTFPDALASQYLSGRLGTGTLLATPTSLPSVTAGALRAEGISHVYVVGGPLAVDTTVVTQIQTMPVYRCGGNGLAHNFTNQTGFIQVTRISGPTAYDTAQAIAQYLPANHVGFLKMSAAYAGGPKGHGAYNDTTGSASAKPSASGFLRTAVLAAGTEFQDAEAASAVAYRTAIPILLTTPGALSSQAATAIVNLHIQQIIVMGGPLAVTNTVEAKVAAMTVTGRLVSVLRVAGKTYGETAVELAKFEVADSTVTLGPDWEVGTLAVTRGNGFTDGVAGAVLEHGGSFPILLTQNPTTVGTALATFLKLAGAGYETETTGSVEDADTLIILGGPLAVTPTIISQMETDLAH